MLSDTEWCALSPEATFLSANSIAVHSHGGLISLSKRYDDEGYEEQGWLTIIWSTDGSGRFYAIEHDE